MTLKQHAENIRRTIIEESYKKQLSHVGSCLSCVEILTALFFKIMERKDIFILSPGHKALALYATLKEKGIIKKIDMEKLGGHPNRNPKMGIHVSTGSLGHGLSLGIGFAIANPKRKVYVLLSDGDMDEGSTWEAMNFIFFKEVRNIFPILDANKFSAYQKSQFSNWVSTLELEPIDGYFYFMEYCNGHDFTSICESIENLNYYYPRLIFAETIKGKGLPRFENKLESHYWKLGKVDYENYTHQNKK